MVDELPQQELFISRIEVEQKTGLFDHFKGAMSSLIREPLERPAQGLPFRDKRFDHDGFTFHSKTNFFLRGLAASDSRSAF